MNGDDEDESQIQLPTVLGAVSSVAKSGPIRDLFGPAAKVLGKYWGGRTAEIVKRWERQKAENLQDHRVKVEEIVGRPAGRPPSEKQLVLVSEWIDGAQDISVEEAEAAALWQSLLADIYSNDAAQEKIDIIKRLNAKDAKFILNSDGDHRIYDDDEALLHKLAALGILSRWEILNEFRKDNLSGRQKLSQVIFFLIIGVAIYLGDSVVRIVTNGGSRLQEAWVEVAKYSVLLAFLFTGAKLVIIVATNLGTYRFTKLGLEIRNSALRFYKVSSKKKSDDQVVVQGSSTSTVNTTRDSKKTKRKDSRKPSA